MGEFHPTEPHWYLPLIGVDVTKQGRGTAQRCSAMRSERATAMTARVPRGDEPAEQAALRAPRFRTTRSDPAELAPDHAAEGALAFHSGHRQSSASTITGPLVKAA